MLLNQKLMPFSTSLLPIKRCMTELAACAKSLCLDCLHQLGLEATAKLI